MRTKFFAFLILSLLGKLALSQQSGQLGFYDFLPQRVYANPALKPNGKVNIGLPFLSNVYIGHNNNWFAPDKYLNDNGDGTARLDAQAVLDNIDDRAFTGQSIGNELIHFGMYLDAERKHYIHLRATERIQFGLYLPKDLFNLAVYGNVGEYQFDSNTANFSDLEIDLLHYREYGVGYSYQINEKWRVGATAKYLYGMERVKTEQSSLKLRTDPNTYELQSSGQLAINTAGIYGALNDSSESIYDDIGNYLFGLHNSGFGGDLGVVFNPIEKLELQFSANDLGFIKWKSDVANYQTDDASFAYKGVDLTNFIFESGGSFDNALRNELDSLVSALEEQYNPDPSRKSFTTALNGFLRYGASYELYKTNKFKGAAWVNFIHGIGSSTVPFSWTIGYNQTIGKLLQASVHYTDSKITTGSIGAGLAFNAGPVQIYCLAENFRFANFTKIKTGSSDNESFALPYPTRPSDIRVNVGINLTFGRQSLTDDLQSQRK